MHDAAAESIGQGNERCSKGWKFNGRGGRGKEKKNTQKKKRSDHWYKVSVRKRPGRPADGRQMYRPARLGQSETDLGLSSEASWMPSGSDKLSEYAIRSVNILPTVAEIFGCLQIPPDI